MPEEMTFGEYEDNSSIFHYLMLFENGNRMDLTLFALDKIETEFENDSLTVLLLDKDNIFKNLALPSDKDYLIKRPSEKEFNRLL